MIKCIICGRELFGKPKKCCSEHKQEWYKAIGRTYYYKNQKRLIEYHRCYYNQNRKRVLSKIKRYGKISKKWWKENDEEILKKWIGKITMKRIKKRFLPYRSLKSIQMKSFKMGLVSDIVCKGENHPMKNPIIAKKVGLSNKGRISNNKGKTYEQIYGEKKAQRLRKIRSEKLTGKTKSEEHKEKLRKARINQKIPRKNTSIEIIMEGGLLSNKIGYKKQKPLICAIPDFFINPNICVFCDGDYWHNLPTKQVKDRRINFILRKNNYKVLRFWEHQINNNFGNCLFKIKGELSQRIN